MKTKSVKCKKCMAPLTLLGNLHRCRHIVCEYCGSVMDSKNEFKQLYIYNQKNYLGNLLSIGSELEIQGATFIVTAYLAYESRNNQWLEYQVYSKTHGYAKLIDKDGTKIFLTKSHHLPNENIWMIKQKEVFSCRNQNFKIIEFQHAEIFYAAGSLIENIKQGQRNKQCFAKSEKFYFQSVYSLNQVKNYIGVKYK